MMSQISFYLLPDPRTNPHIQHFKPSANKKSALKKLKICNLIKPQYMLGIESDVIWGWGYWVVRLLWGMLQEQSVVSGEMDRSHSGKQLLNISFVSKVLSDE